MSCIKLHNSLVEDGEISCPFCDQQLQQPDLQTVEACCDNPTFESENGKILCQNCSQLTGEDLIAEYIDFYQDMYKIRKKSIYNQKYHIENVIRDLTAAHNIQITRAQINQTLGKFNEIQKVLHQVDVGRKRLISIIFIL